MSSTVTSSEQTPTDTSGVTSAWGTGSTSNDWVNVTPDHCIILGVNATVPWDQPGNVVSMEAEYLVDRVKSAILIPLLYLLGAPANVLNMLVFFRQGLLS